MTATAYYVQGRAEVLLYEAIHWPQRAEMALGWLHRARMWAEAQDYGDLAEYLRIGIAEIEDHQSALEAKLLDISEVAAGIC
jgi:hypothetical protein